MIPLGPWVFAQIPMPALLPPLLQVCVPGPGEQLYLEPFGDEAGGGADFAHKSCPESPAERELWGRGECTPLPQLSNTTGFSQGTPSL